MRQLLALIAGLMLVLTLWTGLSVSTAHATEAIGCIELSGDGKYLYWQAIKGDDLYRIPTAALVGPGLAGEDLSAQVEPYGKNGVNDGLLIARGTERMYLTSVQDNAIKVRDLAGGPDAKARIVVQDERLRWPDTFSQGPDGTIYVTTSHIQDSAFFRPDAPPALPTQLWKLGPHAA